MSEEYEYWEGEQVSSEFEVRRGKNIDNHRLDALTNAIWKLYGGNERARIDVDYEKGIARVFVHPNVEFDDDKLWKVYCDEFKRVLEGINPQPTIWK